MLYSSQLGKRDNLARINNFMKSTPDYSKMSRNKQAGKLKLIDYLNLSVKFTRGQFHKALSSNLGA